MPLPCNSAAEAGVAGTAPGFGRAPEELAWDVPSASLWSCPARPAAPEPCAGGRRVWSNSTAAGPGPSVLLAAAGAEQQATWWPLGEGGLLEGNHSPAELVGNLGARPSSPSTGLDEMGNLPLPYDEAVRSGRQQSLRGSARDGSFAASFLFVLLIQLSLSSQNRAHLPRNLLHRI